MSKANFRNGMHKTLKVFGTVETVVVFVCIGRVDVEAHPFLAIKICCHLSFGGLLSALNKKTHKCVERKRNTPLYLLLAPTFFLGFPFDHLRGHMVMFISMRGPNTYPIEEQSKHVGLPAIRKKAIDVLSERSGCGHNNPRRFIVFCMSYSSWAVSIRDPSFVIRKLLPFAVLVSWLPVLVTQP
jgi:hypothetical protein